MGRRALGSFEVDHPLEIGRNPYRPLGKLALPMIRSKYVARRGVFDRDCRLQLAKGSGDCSCGFNLGSDLPARSEAPHRHSLP
jgi:hypothetical protein